MGLSDYDRVEASGNVGVGTDVPSFNKIERIYFAHTISYTLSLFLISCHPHRPFWKC
jgi:hypothetical protein